MSDRIVLRRLTFTGPTKPDAALEFGEKLTLIWGASNTGKSFSLKALNFMLGGSSPLPGIEARDGYESAWLALTLPKLGDVTLYRSLRGGAFYLYGGHTLGGEPSAGARKLSAKHDATTADNLSALLLGEIGLRGKQVATNAFGVKRPLSFRDLGASFLVDETSIQSEHSPIEGGQRSDRTLERSVFRLLLSGTDDGGIVPVDDPKLFNAAKRIRLEVIDQMLAGVDSELGSEVPAVNELEEQLKMLDASTEEVSGNFERLGTSVRGLLEEKGRLAREIPQTQSRLDEVRLHIARFEQLKEVYASDLYRLESLEEVGFLIGLSAKRPCPLCGANPNAQLHSDDHELAGLVREAALAEVAKIQMRSGDLDGALGVLIEDRERLAEDLPRLNERLGLLEVEIANLTPLMDSVRSDLSEIVKVRDVVKRTIELLSRREDLLRHRDAYAGAKAAKKADRPALKISGSAAHQFAQKVGHVLEQWGFPGQCHVTFDDDSFDVRIDGKARIDNGKGVRAVTHAAFKVALLLYCRERGLPHPGFLVLDTPLLTYRDPLKSPRYGELEVDEKELAETSLKDRFFQHLASLDADAQFIVLENVDPPLLVGDKIRIEVFSGSEGRPGLFPA